MMRKFVEAHRPITINKKRLGGLVEKERSGNMKTK